MNTDFVMSNNKQVNCKKKKKKTLTKTNTQDTESLNV